MVRVWLAAGARKRPSFILPKMGETFKLEEREKQNCLFFPKTVYLSFSISYNGLTPFVFFILSIGGAQREAAGHPP